MADEASKAYTPGEVETKWYDRWVEANCFRGDEKGDGEAYSIVIPPPNVTGILHLGHVLNNTIQDILARRARMQGKEVLWLPGTDHAGIATQSKVEQKLRKEDKITRHDLGREKFLEKVWEWKEEHGGIIIQQLKRLGCSCDWSRERFTMDEDYYKWISKIFVDLYEEGLIYRGKRMVNWCPKSLTALSDEEVIMKPQKKSKLYYMRYRIAGEDDRWVEIATTRPETLMGDTAIAVNPKDERYADLVGKKAIRPFPEAEIPVIADDHIDPEFGTGVLKVTPAHDKNDFEIGQKNDLEIIDVFNPDGTLNELAGPDFEGMDRFKAREAAAEKLDEMGQLVKVEDYENAVGYSERADVPIEPRISMQWFMKYPCTDEAKAAVANDEIAFRPVHHKKTFANWMDGIQDWCISRQLWWGHQIPVWYKKDKAEELQAMESLSADIAGDDIYVAVEPPSDESEWVRDEDVLDTWFSSWLWPFATMRSCEEDSTDTLAKFYPTADLVTGPDILFFWVARMIMAGYRWQGELPFKNVYFTSIVRDKKGDKMSKSKGNSPDPLDLIADYGADALRFGLLRIAPSGTDVKYDENQVKEGRNFATKLWNAARYREMQGEVTSDVTTVENPSIFAIDILAKLDQLQKDLEESYGEYKFNEVAQRLYDFFWSNYCDWFLESAKGDFADDADPAAKAATCATMDVVLRRYLMLLHPYMPHLTEELWDRFSFGEEGTFLMNTAIPTDSVLGDISATDVEAAQTQVAAIYEAVGRARNLKATYQLGASKDITFIIDPEGDVESALEVFGKLAGAKEVKVEAGYTAEKGVPVAICSIGKVYMPLDGLIDVDAERERLGKELGKAEKELEKVEAKLSNDKFVNNAPEKVIGEMRERKEHWAGRVDELKGMIDGLG